jgi:hypothetical protein
MISRALTRKAYILSTKPKGAYLEGYAASLRPIAGKNSAGLITHYCPKLS